jgi:uncharacterized protein DUF4124
VGAYRKTLLLTLPFMTISVIGQAQNIYKTVDPDGRVSYSDKSPSNTNAKSNAVSTTPLREGDSAAAPAQKVPPSSANGWMSDDLAPVMLGDLMLAACESAHPDFQGRRSQVYLQWRKRFEPRLTQLESQPGFLARLRSAQEEGRSFQEKYASNDSQDRLRCFAMLSDLAAETQVEKHPEHFATPEATWAYFLQSLRNGDREAVRSCMWGEFSAKISPTIDSMTPGQMREFANSFGQLRFMGDGKNPTETGFRSYNITLHTKDEHSPMAGQIDFQRSTSGWRISSM